MSHVQVNPPPQLRIPDEFFNKPEIRQFFEEQQVILFQIWNRTGGNEDFVAGAEESITGGSARQARNSAKINSLEMIKFEVFEVTGDVTTGPQQILKCINTDYIEVTLDPNAIDDDEVHIKRRDAKIRVNGSIDGYTYKDINRLNYSMHLVFKGGDWSEI